MLEEKTPSWLVRTRWQDETAVLMGTVEQAAGLDHEEPCLVSCPGSVSDLA